MNLSETRFVSPPNPGATPVILAGTTGPKAASTCYTHNVATLAFNTFWNVDHAICQQRLDAVEDNFVQVNNRPHRGYSGSKTLDLLTHLYKTYAVISNTYWLANGKSFRKAYTPTEPIKVVWRQIDDAVAYADAGSTPYLPKQVVDNAYQRVFNTGIFTVDCQECNKRSADDKTLPHFKVFSATAYREWRLLI